MSAWIQKGNVFLWRYPDGPQGYCGGHLTADGSGCSSLVELLNKFIEVPRARSATVRVTRPTEDVLSVPNARNGRARWAAPSELRIEKRDDADPTAWRFTPKGERFELLAGATKLVELRDAIRAIPRGEGDYAIGPDEDAPERGDWDEMCLWIWWLPGSSRITTP